MNNKSFRVQLINKVIADAADALIKNATIYDDVKTKLEEKGFDEVAIEHFVADLNIIAQQNSQNSTDNQGYTKIDIPKMDL